MENGKTESQRTMERVFDMASRLNDVLSMMSCSCTHLLNCLSMGKQQLSAEENAHFKITAMEMTVQLSEYSPIAIDLAKKLQRSFIKTNEIEILKAT